MPLGLLKKVGKYPGTGGLGVKGGVKGGEAPLKLELFLNQNCPESPEKKKKVGRSEKVGKTASLRPYYLLFEIQTFFFLAMFSVFSGPASGE